MAVARPADKGNLLTTILWSGFLVGTLDILSAFANTYLSFNKGPIFVLKYIAMALYGKSALVGGTDVVIYGLLMHYGIAYAFTIFFFVIYPLIGINSEYKITTGILYGAFIWLVMNLVVVPLTNVPSGHMHVVQTTINILILMIMIGLPLSFIAGDFYQDRAKQ